MKRLKSIDTFRGICMAWMIIGHILDWWLQPAFYGVYLFFLNAFDFIGAASFIFVSGLSIAYTMKRKRGMESFNEKKTRNEYLLKAGYVFILAIIYNLAIAIAINDYTMIWTWFVLLTISVSLLLGWPLLKTPKTFRIFLGIVIWILNQFLFHWTLVMQESSQFAAILHYIFYNTSDLDPILSFFPFFLFGTVVGEVVFEINSTDNNYYSRFLMKNKLIYPSLVIGPALIITGVLYRFPNFFSRGSFSWMIYSMGMILLIFSALLGLEIYEKIKTKRSYRIFYYYSYYSLTVFLLHNVIYFLFFEALNIIFIWFSIVITFFSIGLILRIIHNRFGAYASIKSQLGRLASGTAKIIENLIENENSLIELIQRKLRIESY